MLSQTVADARTLPGGGWPEMSMAHAVQGQAARTPGKRSLAMEAFATALRAIPATICDNAGEYDVQDGVMASGLPCPRAIWMHDCMQGATWTTVANRSHEADTIQNYVDNLM